MMKLQKYKKTGKEQMARKSEIDLKNPRLASWRGHIQAPRQSLRTAKNKKK